MKAGDETIERIRGAEGGKGRARKERQTPGVRERERQATGEEKFSKNEVI